LAVIPNPDPGRNDNKGRFLTFYETIKLIPDNCFIKIRPSCKKSKNDGKMIEAVDLEILDFRSNRTIDSVHPEMVGFGSEQGLSDFESAGIARYFEDFKRAKTKLWAKKCRLWVGTS